VTRIRILIALSAAIAMVAASATVSSAADKKLYATMTGKQEKPPADPDGVASAVMTFKSDKVCYDIRPKKAGLTFTVGHIHVGGPNTAGDPVIPLFTTPKKVKGGRLAGCSGHVKASVLNKIRAKPAGYYVNIHNAKYPGGAVRGQLSTIRTS
jgi:hypothetical protein